MVNTSLVVILVSKVSKFPKFGKTTSHDQCKVFVIFIRSNSLLPYNLHVLGPNHIGGVIVSLLASIAVYPGFELQSSQTIYTCYYIKIGICCLSAMHTVLRCKSKDCLAQNHDNVSEWNYMSIR